MSAQPFQYENYPFAHNETITIPDEAAESLGEWKGRIKSSNDSEVYFWHIVKEMANGASFPEAFKKFEKTLRTLTKKL